MNEKDPTLEPVPEEPGPEERLQEVTDSNDPETLRKERDGYLEDLRRLKAEFENYRKRIIKEQTEFVERAAGGVVHNLLGVLDNFELAVGAAEGTKDFEKMLRGVEMVYGELMESLKAAGLELIEAKDRVFDPTFHEAALELDGDGAGDLVVAEVLRPGYLFKGRVLRPAMVKVSRKSAPPA